MNDEMSSGDAGLKAHLAKEIRRVAEMPAGELSDEDLEHVHGGLSWGGTLYENWLDMLKW